MCENKKRVLLVNSAVYLPGEGGYKRTMFMLDMMIKFGYKVDLITSDFNHYNKQTRNIEQFRNEYPQYECIKFLHMPSYKKNISLKRFYSEKIWEYNFREWFKKHYREYDVVFFSDIDNILAINSICEKHNIKKIVDIRDLRPEAFKVVIKNNFIYNILFFPMKVIADKSYACADEFVAVSQEYLDRGLKANNKSKNPAVVYLGSTLNRFDEGVKKYAKEITKYETEIWVTYAGTLGESYDLETLLKTAKSIFDLYKYRVKFKILGQGPDELKLKQMVKNMKIVNVDFLGFLPYEKMAAYLSKSDIMVNAVKKNASQSIINKVADYLTSGKPMLNGCCCKEQQEMVENYKVGLNYEPENVTSLKMAIETLVKNPELRKEYGNNARLLALQKFDRENSYKEILRIVDTV